MPFDLVQRSRIDTTYFTHDGTSTGDPCDVEGDAQFHAFFDAPVVWDVGAAADLTSVAATGIARGMRGVFTLTFSWAPVAVRNGLRAMIGGGIKAFVFYHPDVASPVTLNVEVLRLRPANDGRYTTTDPVEGLAVVCLSHGAP